MSSVNAPTTPTKLLCPAKVNLCLDVIQKDSSGYHQIKTVFLLTTQLQDTLYVAPTEHTDSLSINSSPTKSPTHPALQALKILKQNYKITQNFHLNIDQKIPLSSGLGAGSSAAAQLLLQLNQKLHLNISQKDLLALGAQVGMDVPFFLLQTSVALGENYGEQVSALPDLPPHTLSLAPKTSPLSNKTQESYSKLDLRLTGLKTAQTDLLIQSIKKGNSAQILANLHNDFQQLYPGIPKDENLSGSGPSTFRIHFDH